MQIVGNIEILYQWDKDIRVSGEFAKDDEVHFGSVDREGAYVVKPYEYNGVVVADIPNILLTKPHKIFVYHYIVGSDGSYTKREHIFDVLERPKPDDYVYTQTEVLSYASLDKRIKVLETSGGGGGGSGQPGFSPTVTITPIENGHRVTITDILGDHSYEVFNGEKGERGEQGIQGEKGEQGIQGEKGEKGDDYVLTETDKSEIANLVLANFVDVSEVGQ